MWGYASYSGGTMRHGLWLRSVNMIHWLFRNNGVGRDSGRRRYLFITYRVLEKRSIVESVKKGRWEVFMWNLERDANDLHSKKVTTWNPKMFRYWIVAPISLMFNFASKKTTNTRARLKFGTFMRLEQNETSTTKNFQMRIIKTRTVQTLVWWLIMIDWWGNTIYSIDCIQSSLPPKLFWNWSSNK